ncbi:MAG TPA: hypothetical protein VH302_05205 [Bryobacteraceae bacterium]|jgi:hypothetical protein|nr:hypothetical protein [Bryobacteraceae bacterium]
MRKSLILSVRDHPHAVNILWACILTASGIVAALFLMKWACCLG